MKKEGGNRGNQLQNNGLNLVGTQPVRFEDIAGVRFTVDARVIVKLGHRRGQLRPVFTQAHVKQDAPTQLVCDKKREGGHLDSHEPR